MNAKETQEIRDLLGLDLVILVTQKGRLRWFGHVECTDNASWVKCCMKMESKWNKIEGVI